MATNSWCHFKQRMQRTPLQLAAKQNSSLNWEDEKFSYVVLGKNFSSIPDVARNPEINKLDWSRIVRRPRKKGGHVIFGLCTPEGEFKEAHYVTKGEGRFRYKEARQAKWGTVT